MTSLRHPLSRHLLLALLCGLLGSARAAMLADFNDPLTWGTGWAAGNWGDNFYRGTTNTYQGAGDLVVGRGAATEWNYVTFNLPATQDWSGFTNLHIAAMYGSATPPTGTVCFTYGLDSAWVNGGGAVATFDTTNTWQDFSLSLGAYPRTAVNGIKLFWHGTWFSEANALVFDSIEVPEPTMAAMLGLGALAFLRRRQRG